MSGSELTDEQARGLAARWACTKDSGGRVSKAPELKAREGHEHAADVRRRARLGLRAALEGPLDADELGALLGWVAREMAREVERRQCNECGGAGVLGVGETDSPGDCPSCEGLEPDDHEALAHHIAYALWGGEGDASGVWTFALDGGESGLAWTLCEAAGWPS